MQDTNELLLSAISHQKLKEDSIQKIRESIYKKAGIEMPLLNKCRLVDYIDDAVEHQQDVSKFGAEWLLEVLKNI